MPRSRDRHRQHALLLALLAILFGSVLTGCHQEREPPRQFVPGNPLYDQFTTQGSRITVVDGDGELLLKARRRARSLKAYDHQHRALGRIRWSGDDPPISVHEFTTGRRLQSTWIDEDTAALDEVWRMERAGTASWDLFDGQGTLVGLWRRDEDNQWTLRRTTTTAPILTTAKGDRGPIVIDSDGRKHLSIAGRGITGAAALAMTLEYFEPLQRWTLAMWCELYLDTEDEEGVRH